MLGPISDPVEVLWHWVWLLKRWELPVDTRDPAFWVWRRLAWEPGLGLAVFRSLIPWDRCFILSYRFLGTTGVGLGVSVLKSSISSILLNLSRSYLLWAAELGYLVHNMGSNGTVFGGSHCSLAFIDWKKLQKYSWKWLTVLLTPLPRNLLTIPWVPVISASSPNASALGRHVII